MRPRRRAAWRCGALAITSLGLGGCINTATLPPIRRDADEASRKQTYEAFRLHYETSFFFGDHWERADGEYSLAGIEDITRQYPEPRALKVRTENRRLVLGMIGGIGSAVVGGTLGWNLAANDTTRMSSGAQAALYASGGSLLLLSFVLDLAWYDPAGEIAPAYNRALASDLGVPPSPSPCPTPCAAREPGNRTRVVLGPVPVVSPKGAVSLGVGGVVSF